MVDTDHLMSGFWLAAKPGERLQSHSNHRREDLSSHNLGARPTAPGGRNGRALVRETDTFRHGVATPTVDQIIKVREALPRTDALNVDCECGTRRQRASRGICKRSISVEIPWDPHKYSRVWGWKLPALPTRNARVAP